MWRRWLYQNACLKGAYVTGIDGSEKLVEIAKRLKDRKDDAIEIEKAILYLCEYMKVTTLIDMALSVRRFGFTNNHFYNATFVLLASARKVLLLFGLIDLQGKYNGAFHNQ